MKKRMGAAIAVGAVLSMLAVGTTVFAANTNGTEVELTAPASNVLLLEESDFDTMMENRRSEYEEYVDQQVQNGTLTEEEAAEYKDDFNQMAEYCSRVNGRNTESASFGCH